MRRFGSLALLFLAGTAALPQEARVSEPPYRVDVDRVSVEKRAGRPTLALRATTDLPAPTLLDVSLTAFVPKFDEARKAIVPAAAGNPVVRKVRVAPGGRGKSEFTATQPFPREGEVRIEVSFNPELLFEEDRAAIKKAMGEKFGRMRWEKTVLLGTPGSRLGLLTTRYAADLAWVNDAEKLVRKLGSVSSKNGSGEAITNVCADLNELLAKIEKTEIDSPFPAAVGHLRAVLGRVAAWGAYRVALTARAAAGGDEDAAADGGGLGKGEKSPENDLASYREDAFLGSLTRVRELAVREFALAGGGELLRVEKEISAALQDGWPDDKARATLGAAAEAVRSAVKKCHDTGLSKLGDSYAALFAAEAKEVLEAALARLDQASGLLGAAAPPPSQVTLLAEGFAQDAKAVAGLLDAWRRFDR